MPERKCILKVGLVVWFGSNQPSIEVRDLFIFIDHSNDDHHRIGGKRRQIKHHSFGGNIDRPRVSHLKYNCNRCFAKHFVSALLALGLLLVPSLQETSPVNFILAALSVLTSSSGFAIYTAGLELWSLLLWSLTIVLSVTAITIGYKIGRLNSSGYYIISWVIFGLMLSGAILFIIFSSIQFTTTANIVLSVILGLEITVALYLNGEELKRCGEVNTNAFLPFRLSLITWVLVFLQYMTMSQVTASIIHYRNTNRDGAKDLFDTSSHA
uniref:Uncharacterized protein n=1 Tax=Trichobilharzia regenti TaxID=157069 RepID=A0AA85J463_TRIRE|nr:unnamed protein product [Trichobilharzia regenti]